MAMTETDRERREFAELNAEQATPGLYKALSIFLLFSLFILVGSFGGRRDLHYFECAAPVFYGGSNLYDSREYFSCIFPKGVPSDGQSYVFPYPPQIFIVLAPIFLLPQGLQTPMFIITSALAATAAFVILNATFATHRDLRYSRVAILAWSTFTPLLSNFAMGQLSAFSLLIISLFILSATQQSSRSAIVQGVCLGVFVAKPQLVWLLALGWIVVGARQHRREFIAGMCASALSITLLTVALYPASLQQFLSKGFSNLFLFSAPTISSHLASFIPLPKTVLAAMTGAIVLVFILTSRVRRLSLPTQASVLVAASVLTTPYLWSYDFTLLLPLVVATICATGESVSLGIRWKAILLCNLIMFLDYLNTLSSGGIKPDGEDLWYAIALVLLFAASLWQTIAVSGLGSVKVREARLNEVPAAELLKQRR